MITNYVEKLKQYINENEEISTFDLVEIMGAHTSFLILLLILSLLNIILAPLPINSFIIGIPLTLFSICYLFGIKEGIFSTKLFKKSINCTAWRKHIHKVSHYIEKIFIISKPRLYYLSQLHRRLVSGFVLSTISLLIFLPIPFINTSGSVTMIMILLGIIQKDGLFLIIGYLLFAIHIIFSVLVIFYVVI